VKLKLAVTTGLVAVTMVGLVACATTKYSAGTTVIGGINSPYGRIYTFDEYLAKYPSDKSLAEKTKLDPRGKFVKFSLLKGIFGGGDFNHAYVPPKLAQLIKKGDIIKVVGGEGGKTFNTVTEINPLGCEWKGGGYVSAQLIYCNGKDAMVTLPGSKK
jgi:hypothetical protein